MQRACGFVLGLCVAMSALAGERVPGEHWMRYADPAEAGFDAAQLETARATWEGLPSSAFMVIADGAVVAAWGDVSRRFMCHSVRKSFMSALYGIVWDRGDIELNKTLADLGIDDIGAGLLETEKQARILDLLKARSGIFHPAAYAGRTDTQPRGSQGPGRYFAYNNWDFNTLVTILEQETGEKVFEAFDEYFAGPLGMEDWRVSDGYYHYELEKSMHPAYPFRLSARDAARFGLLFANSGTWGETRILSRNWVSRSTTLYSIDDEAAGYGMLWWVFREPPFEDHGMVAAQGVGRQMIAVLPESGLVIVNRANTYESERTPREVLLGLIKAVLEARTGDTVSDPALVPLRVPEPDPRLRSAPRDQLTSFVGEWPYPPPSFGLPQAGTVRVSIDDDGLVLTNPFAGTFRTYLQNDGSLLEEDSLGRWVAIRDADGSVAEIADAEAVVDAATAAVLADDTPLAVAYLSLFERYPSFKVEFVRALLELLEGDEERSEASLRELTSRTDPRFIEARLAGFGNRLLEAERTANALQVFELNTRLFPEAVAAWDHLGEAHMKLGNDDEAIRSFERSLELDQDNTTAQEMIESIRARGEGRADARRFRVAVAKFQHETCTFCPGGDTRIEDWTRRAPVLRGEEVLESGGYIEGFTDRAREYGDVDLIPLASPSGVYGGSSRSWNTEETFDHFVNLMLEELRAALPVDGVYLALHGAMAVRNVPRPEAEIARRFREVVGPDVPIAATFDLHGNEDEQFLRWADFSFVTKRYPHYDSFLQGERAARALRLAMSGAYIPTTATRKPGVITATVLQWTGQSPAMDIMERARRWETEHSEAYVSVFFGYPWSDVPDVGATVQVMTNADQELADRIADDMSDFIWRHRESFAGGGFPKPEQAAQLVKRALEGGAGPVAVGDYSDRPGDATHILKAFEAAGIGKVLYGTITDPGALEALQAAGASAADAFDREVGGFTPSGGTPVRITGTLVYFGEGFGYERIAAIEFGRDNLLIITPAYEQVTRPEYFRIGPIEPDDYDVFVVKSRVHFRRGFDETGYARTILVVEAPGPFVGTRFLDALPYENVDLKEFYPYGVPAHRRQR